MEGEFVDTVIGYRTPVPRSSRCGRLRRNGAGAVSFIRPNHEPGSPDAMSNELGLRTFASKVDNLQEVSPGWLRMATAWGAASRSIREHLAHAYVRGPEGIIVALAQRID